LASHRKPRPRVLASAGPRAAVGITSAALASVTLMTETAHAAPAKPSISEVKKRIDTLNQQAEVATQKYDQAKEKTAAQRATTNQLLAQVADKTQKMNESRRVLGQFAAQQYRDGGLDQTTQFLLAEDPQSFLNQAHLLDRLTGNAQTALASFTQQQQEAQIERAKATASLQQLTDAQSKLAGQKKDLQTKLAAAQKLLNSLNAEQRRKLAAMQPKTTTTAPSASQAATYTGPATGRAAAAINFALAQIGKPYVSGGTGPNAYDCSGLTQAAYKAAGITIGRTTWDQVKDGTAVSESDLRPGDLVFFYSGISHVGIYLGDGKVVHAPHTGATVEIAPMSWMPFAAARRIA
jgi:cell wall-associated NlpC family hydrolase